MFQIWTEDTTDGYKFISMINRYHYSNLYKVIRHNGNGTKPPITNCPYGGILYHLRNFTIQLTDLILIIIDAAIDKPDTKATYDLVLSEVQNKKNVFIIPQISFETNLLKYENISNIIGVPSTTNNTLWKEFIQACGDDLSTFSPNNFEGSLKSYIQTMRADKRYAEHISKSILSMLCNINSSTI